MELDQQCIPSNAGFGIAWATEMLFRYLFTIRMNGLFNNV